MRLWSLHPSYLDSKGLVALWREGLLARKVLRGKTKGYKNHPQLERFKAQPDPIAAIDAYLTVVLDESRRRGYKFDGRKIRRRAIPTEIPLKMGQLIYEMRLLESKLKIRSPKDTLGEPGPRKPNHNPVFRVVPGKTESWEKVRRL